MGFFSPRSLPTTASIPLPGAIYVFLPRPLEGEKREPLPTHQRAPNFEKGRKESNIFSLGLLFFFSVELIKLRLRPGKEAFTEGAGEALKANPPPVQRGREEREREWMSSHVTLVASSSWRELGVRRT